MRVMIVMIAMLGVGANTGFAQVTFDGCVDFRGLPVVSILNSGLSDVAMAGMAPMALR